MPNYNQCYVYKISSKNKNIQQCYIGSTTNIKKRLYNHRCSANNENHNNYNMELYKFIRFHGGFDSFNFEILEELSCQNKKELHTIEKNYIIQNNNVLNLKIPTRTKKQYYDDNSDKIKEYQKQLRIENIKKYGDEYLNKKREYQTQYQNNNRQKTRDYSNKWVRNNKDHCKKYYNDNIDKIKKYQKQYRLPRTDEEKQKYKEYQKEYQKAYRLKKQQENLNNKNL